MKVECPNHCEINCDTPFYYPSYACKLEGRQLGLGVLAHADAQPSNCWEDGTAGIPAEILEHIREGDDWPLCCKCHEEAICTEQDPHWSDKGKIRLECISCDRQHDEIAAIPPGWVDVEEVRSWERAIEPVPIEAGVNKYGDGIMGWQTHLGTCPECAAAYGEEVKVAPVKTPAPNRVELSNQELAIAAKGFLFHDGGFTIDEYGNLATGNLWAVSVAGKEWAIPGRPCINEIKAYLDGNPIVRPMGDAFFGGWYDPAENITYLDHTLLFLHKHTAVHEGLRNKQKAIHNLQTGETLELAELQTAIGNIVKGVCDNL